MRDRLCSSLIDELSRVWLWTHELQNTKLPCPLLPRVCSVSCPLSQWCYLTISSSAALFSSFPQSFPIGIFSSETAFCIRWPKYWCFRFNISPFKEYSVLISFKIDWFDLLAVQGTLKNFLQHHNLKTSILQHSVFFMIQHWHEYWKNHSFDYMDHCWQSDISAV